MEGGVPVVTVRREDALLPWDERDEPKWPGSDRVGADILGRGRILDDPGGEVGQERRQVGDGEQQRDLHSQAATLTHPGEVDDSRSVWVEVIVSAGPRL